MSVFDVAIVGAGAAGIAAAVLLRRAGKDIVLLESRNRVGGRAAVDQSLGVPADLGAAWLHFARENAWTALAEARGFEVLRSKPGWGAEAGVAARAPTDAERAAVSAAYARYFGLIDAAVEAHQDVSVSTLLPRDAFRPRFDAVMTWAVGVESSDVSALDLSRYAESTDDWSVRQGLGAVVAAVAADLPVRLGATVTRIDCSGPVVRIDSSAGRIEAQAVIVTLPTAVLARDAIAFHPPLPAAHRQAIDDVPLGVVNKVFFRIDGGFAQGLPQHFIGSADTSRTCSYSVNAGGQPLLMAFFGGDLSRELEQRGELEVFARDELRGILGNDARRGLGASLSTGWGRDPHALGSYSAAKPGRAHSREVLASPVSPRLQLAGEACSISHYGTLHGAWLSGSAAAARLL